MKIGNIRIEWHKHKWEWKIDSEYIGLNGWEMKVVEQCVAPNCKAGSYKNVLWIECKNKPEAYRVK
jgi:hypothetical protein